VKVHMQEVVKEMLVIRGRKYDRLLLVELSYIEVGYHRDILRNPLVSSRGGVGARLSRRGRSRFRRRRSGSQGTRGKKYSSIVECMCVKASN